MTLRVVLGIAMVAAIAAAGYVVRREHFASTSTTVASSVPAVKPTGTPSAPREAGSNMNREAVGSAAPTAPLSREPGGIADVAETPTNQHNPEPPPLDYLGPPPSPPTLTPDTPLPSKLSQRRRHRAVD